MPFQELAVPVELTEKIILDKFFSFGEEMEVFWDCLSLCIYILF